MGNILGNLRFLKRRKRGQNAIEGARHSASPFAAFRKFEIRTNEEPKQSPNPMTPPVQSGPWVSKTRRLRSTPHTLGRLRKATTKEVPSNCTLRHILHQARKDLAVVIMHMSQSKMYVSARRYTESPTPLPNGPSTARRFDQTSYIAHV